MAEAVRVPSGELSLVASAHSRLGLKHLGASIVLAAAALYAAAAWYVAIVVGAAHGDAYSRFANAYYVFFSRDPHLAAIGFVWTPLPSLVEMLALPIAVVWPGALASGLAAGAMSVVFTAGAVWMMWLFLGDLGVSTPVRALLTAVFALNPMVVYYGALGTSEGPMLFSLLLTARSLYRWQRDRELHWLVYTGLALALAFLTRYEGLAAAGGVALLVAGFSLARERRLDAMLADVAIVMLPVAVSFALWTLVTWVITGEPFSQFTSAYGNSSQMAAWAAQGANEVGDPVGEKVVRLMVRLTALQPLWLPVGALIAWRALRRFDLRAAAALAPMGMVIAFMGFEYLSGSLAQWLRYLVAIIPLGIVFAGVALSAWRIGERSPFPAGWGRFSATVVLLAFSLLTLPVSALGMLDRSVGYEESVDVPAVLTRSACAPVRPLQGAVRCFSTERSVAQYLDAQDLPEGSVVVDTFSGFAIVTQSQRPKQFVITSDRDFMNHLVDPSGTGVRFLLVPENRDNGTRDAVNRAWPQLYESGAGIAVLDREFLGQAGDVAWRVYRVSAS